jgi:DNA recombination protein Rad52
MCLVVNTNNGSTPTLAAEKPQREVIAQQLEQFLGPEFISYRPGEGGRKLAYVEGHEVIGLLNSIFGWDMWNTKMVHFVEDYATSDNGGKWSVGVAATVRLTVTVKHGDQIREVYREDIGYGTIDNGPGRGKSMEKCRKEAVTDGLKRAARQLGNATGGCLYNKSYLEKVRTVKGPAERIEFLEDDLFRKPVNKRKRFMLAQERVQQRTQLVSRGGRQHDDEYGDSGDDDMFAEIPENEEMFTV